MSNRSLREIAAEIKANWGDRLSEYAAPYVEAMSELRGLQDRYLLETGEDAVLRFLANAQSWRGETAQRVKKELKAMLKANGIK